MPADAVVFENFAKGDFSGWYVTGDAFGPAPTCTAENVLAADAVGPVQAVIGPGIASSAGLTRKRQGDLRSRTFTIDHDKIWFRVGGSGAMVNLIIDGYQLIREPIYGGLHFKCNGDGAMHWEVMDVHEWRGHRAYIEVLDDGDEWVALDRVYFADSAPPA